MIATPFWLAAAASGERRFGGRGYKHAAIAGGASEKDVAKADMSRSLTIIEEDGE